MSSQTFGFDELEENLAALADPKTVDRIGRSAGNRAMKRVEKAIVEALPVGARPTKRRRRRKDGSFTEADYGRVTTNVKIRRIGKGPGQTALVWTVNTGHAFWWWMNEFGTVNQAANPVVRVTWERESPSMPAEIGEDMWAGLERTARRRGVAITGRSS